MAQRDIRSAIGILARRTAAINAPCGPFAYAARYREVYYIKQGLVEVLAACTALQSCRCQFRSAAPTAPNVLDNDPFD